MTHNIFGCSHSSKSSLSLGVKLNRRKLDFFLRHSATTAAATPALPRSIFDLLMLHITLLIIKLPLIHYLLLTNSVSLCCYNFICLPLQPGCNKYEVIWSSCILAFWAVCFVCRVVLVFGLALDMLFWNSGV